jgi:hypothetical protein
MAYAARPENCPYIISWKGNGISEVKTAWNKARVRAKLPRLLIHDLRRTAVRNTIRTDIPEKQAMRISGHKSRSIFDRYDNYRRMGRSSPNASAESAAKQVKCFNLAPQVGFEPTTLRLTAECSTVELLRSISLRIAQTANCAGLCKVGQTH